MRSLKESASPSEENVILDILQPCPRNVRDDGEWMWRMKTPGARRGEASCDTTGGARASAKRAPCTESGIKKA